MSVWSCCILLFQYINLQKCLFENNIFTNFSKFLPVYFQKPLLYIRTQDCHNIKCIKLIFPTFLSVLRGPFRLIALDLGFFFANLTTKIWCYDLFFIAQEPADDNIKMDFVVVSFSNDAYSPSNSKTLFGFALKCPKNPPILSWESTISSDRVDISIEIEGFYRHFQG